LYPGTQITLQHTPELAKAARVTLERRLANGGGQTGWSRAWVVNYWDHLGEGEKAYESLQVMFRQSTFSNLMDTHPPGVFQIDGNLGAANGMLEALVQSFWYPDHVEVHLLPALPSPWNEGSLRGVRIRGGAELEMQWSGSRLSTITWQALQAGDFDLHLPSGQSLSGIRTANGETAKPFEKSGVVRFHADKGQTYLLRFK
jgi:alpha-L-fucosidase 2